MAQPPEPERIIGRYALFDEIASGGMATVHLGRLIGPAGFARIVAIKRLHPQFAKDPEFVAMFLDEARLAARIRHPNVVSTLDVVALEGELFIVMDYVEGESLARVRRLAGERGPPLPVDVSRAIFVNVLHGLHAAHETRGETGALLGLIHRDVSPQNVLVGVDGIARLVDFGVAKAAGRLQQTKEGVVKGKIAYMAPEQLQRGQLDRRTDVYSSAVVLWEVLAGRRLFTGDNEFQVAEQIIRQGVRHPPSYFNPHVVTALDEVVLRGLSADPAQRYATALDMADAVEQSGVLASARSIGQRVQELAADTLSDRARRVSSVESAEPHRTATAVVARDPSAPSWGGPSAAGVVDSDQPTVALAEPAPVASTLPLPSRAASTLPQPSNDPREFAAATATRTLSTPGASAPTLQTAPPKGTAALARFADEHRAALIGVGIAFAVAFGVGLTVIIVRASTSGSAMLASSAPEPTLSDTAASSLPVAVASVVPPLPPPVASVSQPAPSPRPAAPTVAAPRPAPRPANTCNPPHYFDGPIKKLKPGCY